MRIHELHIHHFRNLHQVNLQPKTCNVILGNNGSGKTSLLESIYLLSRGKSFRHHQPKHYIEHGFHSTTVFARLTNQSQDTPHAVEEQSVAIEKTSHASTQLRLNGQNLLTQSPLARLVPTLLLEPGNLGNLEVGSQVRREILDWLLFHVEPKFHPEWMAYQRLLKQRNALLRQLKAIHQLLSWKQQEILAWDTQLGRHAQAIHQQRETILAAWQTHFDAQIQVFLPQYAKRLRLRYSAGYDVSASLDNLLAQRFASDIELGYTRLGSHRADMNVVFDNVSVDEQGQKHKHTVAATDVLSRGERKLLMFALRLSQLPLLNSAGKIPIVLLDDITAELDMSALEKLLNALNDTNSQLFITSLSNDILPLVKTLWDKGVNVFHVEHGKILPEQT